MPKPETSITKDDHPPQRRVPRLPSFRDRSPASAGSSRCKRANRSSGGRHEAVLRKALRDAGITFKSHVTNMPGKPDIVLTNVRLAVFCDGDFWHGRNWPTLKQALRARANADYWIAKVAWNRARDRHVTQQLSRMGWMVLRFWETEILENASRIAAEIRRVAVDAVRNSQIRSRLGKRLVEGLRATVSAGALEGAD